MNKSEFVNHIADQHKCTKVEAEQVINMFTSSVIDAIGHSDSKYGVEGRKQWGLGISFS